MISSEVTIYPQSSSALARAFQGRIRQVERAPGFQRIEVWADATNPVLDMVSWWDSEDESRAYMRSPVHRASHDRILTVPHMPRGTGVRRQRLLTEPLPDISSPF